MRITYIVHTRFPAEKAYGLQIAAVCSALADLGHEVTIAAPHTKNYIPERIHDYYGLPGSIKFVRLKNFDALGKWWIPGPLWMVITMYFYKRALRKFLANASGEASRWGVSTATHVLYVRSPLVLKPLVDSGLPVVLELHTIPRKFKSKFINLCNKCKKIVCLTSPMRDEVIKLGVKESLIMVEGDGVDFEKFQNIEANSDWNLPDIPVVGYVGSLATQDKIEKGVPELLRALKELKENGTKVFGWIVGGPEDWKNAYKELASSLGLTEEDVRFEGRVEQKQVPSCIAACDVCVYPAPATDHPFVMRDTSPLKLLEYLAAGKPVVCADIPPVHDIVDESVVEFCEPGDAALLADGIKKVIKNSDVFKVDAGRERARGFDWRRRMERILEGLKV